MEKKLFKVLTTESYGNQVLIIYNVTEGYEVNRYDGQMLMDFHETIKHLQENKHYIEYATTV